MRKPSTIDAFFKRKNIETTSNEPSNLSNEPPESSEKQPEKSLRVEIKEDFDINSLERDPGLRQQIWEYPFEKRDEVRRAYIKAGPLSKIWGKTST